MQLVASQLLMHHSDWTAGSSSASRGVPSSPMKCIVPPCGCKYKRLTIARRPPRPHPCRRGRCRSASPCTAASTCRSPGAAKTCSNGLPFLPQRHRIARARCGARHCSAHRQLAHSLTKLPARSRRHTGSCEKWRCVAHAQLPLRQAQMSAPVIWKCVLMTFSR
jgi:hypothetical protein